ncbi:MAG TPA: TatD family deoxyribonuclease [Gammaproteobacteria bacterium]|nr:TatD family deoxyribonuclease [Gammaproteobacteria bacterium]
MTLIDTHCHLDHPAFDADRRDVLARCRQRGVSDIVVPGVTAAHFDRLLHLCAQESGLHPALGLHPLYLARHRREHLDELAARIAAARPVAVGEIGLDYFAKGADRKAQQTLFEAQLDLARAAGLPVLLHVRKAHDAVLASLNRHPVPGGICHAFNGSLEQAARYLELGFKLGFGGMLTSARATRLRRLARALPADSIVLETDAPDLPPASHRGGRNSPEYLPQILAVLAEVRGQKAGELARRTSLTAREVLRLA